MPQVLISKRRSPWKRHTWPRTEVGKLETIPESPRTPTKSEFQAESVTSASTSQEAPQPFITRETDRAQLFWCSHLLEESQQDRQKLSNRVKQLEAVCKSQAKANAALLQDIRSWRSNYDVIETELIEAAQEIEEVRAHVKNVEAANENLRHALDQASEEAEIARRKRWTFRLSRLFRPCILTPLAMFDLDDTSKRKKEALSVARTQTPEPFQAANRSRDRRVKSDATVT